MEYHSDRFNSEINSDVSMLSDRDKELIKKSLNKEWTNPKFKLKWFVGNAQITPFAKFRQWLLEIKTKEEAIENMEYELAKHQVEIERFKRLRDASTDDLDKRMAEIEMWNLERLHYMSKRRIQDWYLERQHLVDLLKEFLDSDEAKLKDGSGRTYMDIIDTEEEDKLEAEIWTNRLAKQAACDLIFYGRINSGNMDAILTMSAEQQAETLALGLNFATQLQQYTNNLQLKIDEKLKLSSSSNNYDLVTPAPLIDTTENVQSKSNGSVPPGGLLDVYSV
jgi:hypothetical protein